MKFKTSQISSAFFRRLDNHIVIALGCSELQLPAVKPAGKSRFTTFWGAITIYIELEIQNI
jgi:hypothetical protein